jgi:signal transduction histidine kinase
MRLRVRNLGVAARLTGAFLIVGVLIAILEWVSIKGLARVQRAYREASREYSWACAAHSTKAALLAEIWAQKNYLLRGDESYLRQAQERAQEVSESRDQLAAFSETESARADLRRMDAQIRSLRDAFARAVPLRREGDVEAADGVMRGKSIAVIAAVDASTRRAEEYAAAAARAATEESRRVRLWTTVIALSIAVSAGALGIGLSLSVTRPVGELRRAVETVAAGGDLAERPRPFFRDELFQVSDAFRELVRKAALLRELETRSRRLEALSARVVRAQEEERARIARELHDSLGQTLTAIKLELGAAAATPGGQHSDVAPRLTTARRLADETLGEMRRLALDLRPPALDNLGLVPALRSHARQYAEWSPTCVAIETQNMDERLPAEVETSLYRVAQEALANVAKHAGASHVWIHLTREESTVTLLVRDDGQGMDLNALSNEAAIASGLGLLSMRQRAQELGGHLEIESAPGKGTVIRVQVPISQEKRSWND